MLILEALSTGIYPYARDVLGIGERSTDALTSPEPRLPCKWWRVHQDCANSAGFSKAKSELVSRMFRFSEPREVAGYETYRVFGDPAAFRSVTCDCFDLAAVSYSRIHAHRNCARLRTGFAATFLPCCVEYRRRVRTVVELSRHIDLPLYAVIACD